MHRLYLVTLALVVALLAGCATVGAPERLTDGSTYVIEMPGERDGYRRSYRLHVPEGYRETETVPLVVVVHGAFSTSAEFEQHTGFSELADREGFIVAYPDGIGILGFLQHWNAGHCCGKAAADGVDDVGFVADVIDDVKRVANVDPDRVYMVGFSNGAMLTHRFAVERPGVLAAAAPLTGSVGRDGAADSRGWDAPGSPSALPVIMVHGKRDRRIPYGDPMLTDTSDWGTGVGALDFWAARNGCATRRSERSSAFSDVTIDAWTDCDRGADVQLLTLGEWGHRWPGPHFTLGVEPDSGLYGFDASEIIWEFFRNYERSAQYVRASL